VISAAQRDAIKTQSIFSRRAYDAAMFSLGGLTREQFSAKHPGFDLAEATEDAEFVGQVELYAALPQLQEAALEASVRRGLIDASAALNAKLQDPESTAGGARDAGDLMTKLAAMVDRREAARRDGGGIKEVTRQLTIGAMTGRIRIRTPDGATEIDSSDRTSAETICEVALALRCTTDEEIDRVIAELHSPRITGCTFRGF
jgi:hypothetical protein